MKRVIFENRKHGDDADFASVLCQGDKRGCGYGGHRIRSTKTCGGVSVLHFTYGEKCRFLSERFRGAVTEEAVRPFFFLLSKCTNVFCVSFLPD